jgi:hypothetical protein
VLDVHDLGSECGTRRLTIASQWRGPQHGPRIASPMQRPVRPAALYGSHNERPGPPQHGTHGEPRKEHPIGTRSARRSHVERAQYVLAGAEATDEVATKAHGGQHGAEENFTSQHARHELTSEHSLGTCSTGSSGGSLDLASITPSGSHALNGRGTCSPEQR